MLRLTHESTTADHSTIRAEGRLVGEWAALLEAECTRSARAGGRVLLDLGAVSDVDQGGLDVLRRLRRAKVVLHGCTPIMLAMLGETTP